ncbi:MAG: lipopolysaccharide heptosyltransferase II [Chlamydiales bacterium]|nr:lipopolysaccharide heptosyltransferase II [Chlamydiia bacterium]MCP5508016.1 lipopolysaccharide heptosyltransferase II [Chlamydiales bacterium]
MTVIWPAKEAKNIIVRMPNWLGDCVMATPLLYDLHRRYPTARMTVMCQKNVAPLLEKDPTVDEIFSFKRPSGWLHSEQHQDIIGALRHGEFDLGILTTNSFSSAWWFWRGHVKNRLGYRGNLRSFMLDKALPLPENVEQQHLVITYKMLLVPLGIPISDTPLSLYVTDKEREAAIALLKSYGCNVGEHTVVGINPGAAYGSAKCWLPERFEQVTRRLLEDPDTYIVYFGDPAGAPLVNAICNEMPKRVINLAGKTSIRELMALTSCCSAFLSNDSGPMHIAAALKVPLVALFGSTSDVKTRPYQHGTVIHKHVSCSPCYKRVCPIDFRCMTRIEVDEVCNEILAQINQTKLKVVK